MKLTLGNNQKRRIPGRPGRKALVLFLKTGSAVWGFGPTTGTADALGAELAGGTVFNSVWTAAGTGWTLSAGNAEYTLGTAQPTSLIRRPVTGMSPFQPHKLTVTTTGSVTGVFRVSLGGVVIGSITAVETKEFIVYPGAADMELVIAPEERASAAFVHITEVSLKAFTATEGIPLPEEQMVSFTGDDPRTFAGNLYLCAGAGGAEVLMTEAF